MSHAAGMLGTRAEEYLQDFTVDKDSMGANAFSVENVASTPK